MTVLSSNPLDTKGNKKNIDPLSSNNHISKKTESKSEAAPLKENLNSNALTKQISTQNKYLNLSLLMSSNFSINSENMDSNWLFIKKNLMDLFCSNFSLEVRSIYSFNLNEEEGNKYIKVELQKNYKIEAGRCRLEELEDNGRKKKLNILSSGEYVAKMEVLKREMLQVKRKLKKEMGN